MTIDISRSLDTKSLSEQIDRIADLPEDWHGCGSVTPGTLRAILAHAAEVGPIERTVETGSGKTTLLFSHLSPDHLVFSYDHAGSVGKVRQSELCRHDSVTWVEGFTQQTIPRHHFGEPFQIVLIDGPHGYPFPDLEYYYLYPHVAPGGLLLLDDIQIPTIGRMKEILEADEMFDLLEVHDNMAFFRRTAKPTFDPTGDGWWLQGYNAPLTRQMFGDAEPVAPKPRKLVRRAGRAVGKLVPQTLRRRIKDGLRSALWDA